MRRFLAVFLLLLVACGGAAPPKAAHPPTAAPAVAPPEASDRDADGVPDKVDKCPEGSTEDGCGGPALPEKPPTGKREEQSKAKATAIEVPVEKLLIYTAKIEMAVYQVDSALAAVEAIGKDVGGYMSARADNSITIRVPRAKFLDAIRRIEGTGDVVHRNISAEDVTAEFLDVEIRLKNARAMRDRLQELLAKAQVKDALEIEKELARVTEDIERMEGRLKFLRDQVSYSTITVTFDSRAAALRSMPLRLPFGWLQELGLPRLLDLREGAGQ
jgi:hypothetical protein